MNGVLDCCALTNWAVKDVVSREQALPRTIVVTTTRSWLKRRRYAGWSYDRSAATLTTLEIMLTADESGFNVSDTTGKICLLLS
jgi:hypothetical protein